MSSDASPGSTQELVQKWDSFIESMYEEQSQDIASIFASMNETPPRIEPDGEHNPVHQRQQMKDELSNEMAAMRQYLKMQSEDSAADKDEGASFLADSLAQPGSPQRSPQRSEPPWHMQKNELEQQLLQTLSENAQLKAKVLH